MKYSPMIAVTMLLHFASGSVTAVDAQTPIDSNGVVTRRVATLGPGQIPSSKMSAAGGSFVYTHWSPLHLGSLFVFDLAEGGARKVVKATDEQFSEFSVLSPDGTQIAYAWFNGEQYDLRVVGTDGSEPRVLFEDPEVFWLAPYAWSPDGSEILAHFLRRGKSNQTVLVSPEDGSHRVLRTGVGCSSFSPDGSFVACARNTGEESNQRDIFLLATDGSLEVPVIRHPADDVMLGWAPDGTILFLSDRSGTPSAWAIRTEGGEPRGEPFMIKADLWGIKHYLGFAGDGSFYYSVELQDNQVFVAELDSTAPTGVGASIPVGGDYHVIPAAPEWSPDGRYLAFLTDKGPIFRRGSRGIVVRSMATGDTHELVPNLAFIQSVRWTSDGLGFFTIGFNKELGTGLYRIDAQTAEIERIATGDYIPGTKFAASETTIYFNLSYLGQEPRGTIVAHDLRTGEQQELYTSSGNSGPLAVSPDGSQLAILEQVGQEWGIQLLPTAGGTPRTVMQVPDDFGIVRIGWTPDGQHLFVTGIPPSNGGGSAGPVVMRVPIAGGEPTVLSGLGAARGLRVHPDGRQIAFSRGVRQFEIWVMENIPLLEPLRTPSSRR
jgi:Tol biopolymer transport system component